MSDVLILKGPNNVVDAVDVSDVAQEMISKALALRGSADDTGDINNLEYCSHFRFGFEHLAEFLEPVVRDGDDGFVGLDGAEGVVFCWYVEIGEDVIGA